MTKELYMLLQNPEYNSEQFIKSYHAYTKKIKESEIAIWLESEIIFMIYNVIN